ncbi:unnamed protein product [Miscanthus lutarioriparius]|uniref:Myb/SANT-like domain-containing protein n=1 Tax=Miscanthus lutarioriparius TaxID=422564 RepID=A0A811NI89_9POAL|nr:unnamed protein product [Miscanthus lutarioriparius]
MAASCVTALATSSPSSPLSTTWTSRTEDLTSDSADRLIGRVEEQGISDVEEQWISDVEEEQGASGGQARRERRRRGERRMYILMMTIGLQMLVNIQDPKEGQMESPDAVVPFDLLKEHDVPGFRTHNAWSKDAWTTIVNRLNTKFNTSFSLGQVKQKEQDLKKAYRSVKDLVAESDFQEANLDILQHSSTPVQHMQVPPNSTQLPSEVPECRRGKKQKTKSTSPDDGFHERYLKLKREEIDRFASIEEKKLEDPYSINKCITVLEGLNGLQMADILEAADIFKNKENREVFLSFSSDALRLAWIIREIGRDHLDLQD